MLRSLLIIFYRNPQLGKVKTRLAATLGEEKALAIYLQLVAHTRSITAALPVEIDKVVFYSDFVDTEDSWSNNHFKKHLQTGNDLGERMRNAFDWGFKQGYTAITIVGTDCFELTTQILATSFQQLKENDAIIGPASDGGYYLLGMNTLHDLFENKTWSSNSVFTNTVADFENLKLKFFTLPVLSDIDVEADLRNATGWSDKWLR
jgi:uncharacterized protein